MKCIHCQHDSKYRERSGGKCPRCHRRFAFEPRNGDPLTDGVFAAAIERVSAGGSVRFNAEHLYYDVRRRHLYRPPASGLVIGCVFAALALIFIVGSAWLTLLLLGAMGGSYVWFRAQGSVPWRSLPRAKFDELLRRYVQAHGALSGLIERRTRSGQPTIDPQEMLAYSFDRAVICDRPETVDVLIANQFHFENNCAVLAVNGYPPHAFETVRAMLRNNPRLVVVALHDASVVGCQLAHRLRHDPAWFKDGVAVLDIGLRPAHRTALRGQHERVSARPVASGTGISSEEAHWLSRNMLALAVVAPEQIIKRLFRAISLVEERQEDTERGDSRSDSGSDSGGGSGSDSSGGSGGSSARDLQFELDADVSDGGGDSFG